MSIETYQGGNGNGVAHYQPAPGTMARTQPRTVVRLTEWAESAHAAYEVAEKLVQTSFVPEAFHGKPHEATAAILAGDEVGLSPMAALRSFDIIQGTAAPRAMTLRAIVQSQGHEVRVVESTASRCVVAGRRHSSGVEQQSVWTIDRAKQLKLTGKPNWQNQPQAMLLARATSELCRMIASDAILGVPYAVEELTDGEMPDSEPAQAETPPTQQPVRRTAQRRNQPRTAPQQPSQPEPQEASEPSGPPLPGEEGYDEPGAQTPEQPPAAREPAVTKAQLTKLGAIFTEADIKSRDTRLAVVSHLVGRAVDSSSDLTRQEASGLIDTLERMSEGGDLATIIAELLDRRDDRPADDEGDATATEGGRS